MSTDLGQNAVFHNVVINIRYIYLAFNIQDDRRTRGLLAKPSKNCQNHLCGQPVPTFAVRAVVEGLNKH